jgi:replicative DNA helicase
MVSTVRDLNPKRTMKKAPIAPQDFLKIPPHSNEAEQAVLGGLMLDNEAWDKVCERVSETDFYRHEHRLIFTAVAQLAEQRKPFDVLTLSENLKNHNQLTEAGGEAYLFELAKNTPSASCATPMTRIS